MCSQGRQDQPVGLTLTSSRTKPPYGKPLPSSRLPCMSPIPSLQQNSSSLRLLCLSPHRYIHLSDKTDFNKSLTGIIMRINGLQQLSMFLQHGGGKQQAKGWWSRVSRPRSSAVSVFYSPSAMSTLLRADRAIVCFYSHRIALTMKYVSLPALKHILHGDTGHQVKIPAGKRQRSNMKEVR